MGVAGRILQESLDQSVALGVTERSTRPEIMKAAKKQKIRWREKPCRPKRKRMVLDGVYTRDGEPIGGDEAVSAAIVAEWAAVFDEGIVDDDATRFFASFIESGSGATSWTGPRGRLQELAPRAARSAPGPDGVPCAFWARGHLVVLGRRRRADGAGHRATGTAAGKLKPCSSPKGSSAPTSKGSFSASMS